MISSFAYILVLLIFSAIVILKKYSHLIIGVESFDLWIFFIPCIQCTRSVVLVTNIYFFSFLEELNLSSLYLLEIIVELFIL